MRSRNATLGAETVIYQENAAGHVFLSSRQSPLKEGYMLKYAETAADADKIFARLSQQEAQKAAKMNEREYNRRKEKLIHWRDGLLAKLSNLPNDFSRDFVKSAIQAAENKLSRLENNSVYGVSAMQLEEAPLERPNLLKSSAKSEVIQ